MPSPLSCAVSNRVGSLLALIAIVFVMPSVRTLAQTNGGPIIKVESHEVILPMEVIRQTKSPTGAVVGPNGELRLGWGLVLQGSNWPVGQIRTHF